MQSYSRGIVAALALLALTVPAVAWGVSASAAATVSVTAGKPSELRFTLSKKSVPKGKVTFRVRNAGTSSHDFRIGGKTTRLLRPGRSATLTVAFRRAGRFPYLCTVPGHAAAGMRGVLSVR